MFDSMRNRVYGREETFEKLGVPPEQVCEYLALTGDSSDNVPGVPKVGPKTAAALLADHADLEAIYAHLEGITRKSVRATLETHERRRVPLPQPGRAEEGRAGGAGSREAPLRRRGPGAAARSLRPPGVPPPPGPARAAADHARPPSGGDIAPSWTRSCTPRAGRAQLALYTLAEGRDPLSAPVAGVALAWKAEERRLRADWALYTGVPEQLRRPRSTRRWPATGGPAVPLRVERHQAASCSLRPARRASRQRGLRRDAGELPRRSRAPRPLAGGGRGERDAATLGRLRRPHREAPRAPEGALRRRGGRRA